MTRIEVFADIMCPFTHVGLKRLVLARDARGKRTSLIVRAWPLEWVNGAPIAVDLVAREIDALRVQIAPDLFTGFNVTDFPHTSIPAFGLASVAYDVAPEVGEAVSLRIRDALFEEGHNIADLDVLRMIGAEFGVQPLPLRTASDRAVRDWNRGKRRGVAGSPHFFVGRQSWFCPTLSIAHEGDRFAIDVDEHTRQAFYASALG
jgi:predicted DsbA family dithiol-disulfide isomerase